jgi:hypothetical protein
MKKNIRIFISYSHKDESYKDELITHLAGLKRAGYIESWDDRKILPGQQWNDEIANSLNNANLILFLLSADFIASEYVYKVEIQAAKEKYKRQEATIVPIIIRGCDFPNSSLSNFQALPKIGQAINTLNNRDDAWMNVINELKRIIIGEDPVESPTENSGVFPTPGTSTVTKNRTHYIKYAIIALVILTILIIAIVKFNSTETTGIKGNNNDNNSIQIEK